MENNISEPAKENIRQTLEEIAEDIENYEVWEVENRSKLLRVKLNNFEKHHTVTVEIDGDP